MNIRGIDGIPPQGRIGAATDLELGGPDGSTSASTSFADLLGGLVVDASAASNEAAIKIDDLARGASDDLHGTMIAAKEAEISVKLVGSIRNKLIDAFQELWRTNV